MQHRVDLVHNPGWAILPKEHRDLETVDLVRFTFELDEALAGICDLVATIFGSSAGKTESAPAAEPVSTRM
jgi:hypothetical protein